MRLSKESSIFCRLSLLCGLVLGISLLWSGGAINPADDASAPTAAVEEGEPNDAFGVLEFRIAPRRPSFRGPSPLTKQGIAQCRKDLTENGPSVSIERNDEFVWMKIMPGVELPKYNPYQITQKYQGVEYLLVHNWPPFVMSSEMGWGLQGVTKDTRDNVGRPAIGFQSDQDGSNCFHDLTSANTNQALAIIVEGKVVSAPNIDGTLRGHGMIPGRFTVEQIDDMTKALGKIARPVSSTAVPVTQRSVGIYLIPVLAFVLVVSLIGFLIYR